MYAALIGEDTALEAVGATQEQTRRISDASLWRISCVQMEKVVRTHKLREMEK